MTEWTSVTEAGSRYLKLGRNASYDAAKKGLIPTVKAGRKLLVPVAAMERLVAQMAERAFEKAAAKAAE